MKKTNNLQRDGWRIQMLPNALEVYDNKRGYVIISITKEETEGEIRYVSKIHGRDKVIKTSILKSDPELVDFGVKFIPKYLMNAYIKAVFTLTGNLIGGKY